jgi:hypothetical protein
LVDLLAYRFGDLSHAKASRIHEHSITCGACMRRLEVIEALGSGIRDFLVRDRVAASVTADSVERAKQRGARIRTYRLAPGEQVACTASPDDDLVLVKLALEVSQHELEAADALDIVWEGSVPETGERRSTLHENIALDLERREAWLLYGQSFMRGEPRVLWKVEARLRGPGGLRLVATYVLDHRPWGPGEPN